MQSSQRLRLAVMAVVLGPGLVKESEAANRTWVAGDGNWTGTVNWSGSTVPINNDSVFLTVNAATTTTVNYDNPSATQTYPNVTINQTGGAALGLRQLAATTVNATAATIGSSGLGLWQIGSGTANIGIGTVANGSSSVGTMTLGSGVLAVADDLTIGQGGAGAYSQPGGQSTFGSELIVANLASATGLVTLGGGTLTSNTQTVVGNFGVATFNHNGGRHSTGSMTLALSPGSSATYNMASGTLSANHFKFGTFGAATFNQTGGAASAGSISLPSGAGTARYDLLGGSLTVSSSVTLSPGGTFNQNGGLMGGGTFTIDGGRVEGILASVFGHIVYNSGTVAGRINNLSGTTFNADCVLGDGFDQNAAAFTLLAGRTITTNGNGLRQLQGTFTQSGNINSVESRVGSASTFTQAGGVHTTDQLQVGIDGGAGTYNLNGGTLSISGASPNGLSLGVDFPGTFNIGGGRANVNFFRVGDGALGTVSHTGAGDVVSTGIFVGNQSPGTYTQNNAAAAVTTNSLTIGNNGNVGTYTLQNGTLQVNSATTNNGTFIQSGGRATLQAVGGTGRMDIINTASLTVDRIRQDFLFVADTARIFTVANGGANGVSRLNSLFFEDFENLNFFGKWDLNNNDLVIDSDAATQADEYDRTKRYIQSGFNVGSWTGNGLNSSAAIAAAPTFNKTGLGYARAADVLAFSGGTATFVGQVVDDTTVLVRYTLLGDSDLNGVVDIGDFAFLAPNFNAPSDWRTGDYTYDGLTNLNDFALLASNFNKVLAGDLPRGAAVPEPAMVGLVVLPLLRRRRR